MTVKDDGICFDIDKSFTGMFTIPDIGSFAGKLHYRKNDKLEINLYAKEQLVLTSIDEVFAMLSDENEKMYLTVFYNCRFHATELSSVVNGFVGYFDYALFSNTRYFNTKNDNLKRANIYINIWNEFCFPQGFKTKATFKPVMEEFRLRNRMKISFKQGITSHIMSNKNIFNTLFVHHGIPAENVNQIEEQLKNTLRPFVNFIGIKNSQKHQWYISLENIPKCIGVEIASYYINVLIKCLSHNFGSEITKIQIISKDYKNNEVSVPIYFDYLYSRHIINKDIKYTYQRDVFNFYTFSSSEWKTILNNLYSNKKNLEPFFDIIYQNNYETCISEYHLERYIDCVAAIGNNKKYGNEKYEKVLADFVSDIETSTKNRILNIFKKSLKDVDCNNKNKKNWSLIGLKLSNLRAMTTHFNDTSKRVNMLKFLDIYFILELVSIDYIFEILGIDKSKRLAYKKNI